MIAAANHVDGASTERGVSRYRRVLLSSGGSVAARALSILTTLVSVPLILNYLGKERYGLFVTVQSIVTLTNILDLGMGNSLVNAVATAAAHDRRDDLRRVIASTFFTQLTICVVLLGLFFVALPWLDLPHFYNVEDPIAAIEARRATIVFCVLFCASLPVSLVTRVQTGHQETHWVAIGAAIANVLALGGQFVSVRLGLSLTLLVAITTAAPLVVQTVTWAFMASRRRWLAPVTSAFDTELVREVLRTSAGFLVLQLATLFAFTSDNFVLTRMLDPAAVTQYAVPQRLFGAIMLFLNIAMAPFWPAFGDAKAHGEHGWIKKALLLTFTLVFATSGIGALVICLGFRWIIAIWLHDNFTVDMSVVTALAVWTVMSATTNVFAIYLNGIGEVTSQATLAVVMSIVALILKIVLVNRFGVVGVVAGTVIAYAVITIPGYTIIVRRVLRAT